MVKRLASNLKPGALAVGETAAASVLSAGILFLTIHSIYNGCTHDK